MGFHTCPAIHTWLHTHPPCLPVTSSYHTCLSHLPPHNPSHFTFFFFYFYTCSFHLSSPFLLYTCFIIFFYPYTIPLHNPPHLFYFIHFFAYVFSSYLIIFIVLHILILPLFFSSFTLSMQASPPHPPCIPELHIFLSHLSRHNILRILVVGLFLSTHISSTLVLFTFPSIPSCTPVLHTCLTPFLFT